jgi:hypothetical protein
MMKMQKMVARMTIVEGHAQPEEGFVHPRNEQLSERLVTRSNRSSVGI